MPFKPALLLSIIVGAFLGHLFASFFTPSPPSPPPDPSYNPPPPPKCPPPPRLHHRAPTPPCLKLLSVTATSVRVKIDVSKSVTLSLSNTHCTEQLVSYPLNASVTLGLSGLAPDTDYTVTLPPISCRSTFSTPPINNLLLNPSFETVADPPFTATRFRSKFDKVPRHWTPFYNGRCKRVCGVLLEGDEVVAPRSGDCMLQLGGQGVLADEANVFHGAHQGVVVGGRVMVSGWYRTAGIVWRDEAESEGDKLALIVGRGDGVKVELEERGEWTRVCVVVEGGGAVHVYWHLHDVREGSLFVDDVGMRVVEEGKRVDMCYSGKEEMRKGRKMEVKTHLVAERDVRSGELTVVVPMTAERVLRLEALVRYYGGGSVVAAVAVRSLKEVEMFVEIWRRKMWLRRHVNVTFVRRGEGALAINALRNVAVRMVRTEFVVMLDVDMTPTGGWECLRGGEWLQELLPKGVKRVLTAGVFIGDVHHRAARSKMELFQMVNERVGTVYCHNSQRSHRIRRWYAENDAVEVRFTTDFEPYGISRREGYVMYDERFEGYGFNKVAWGVEVSVWGRMYLLPQAVITHLNHVENDWVRRIDVSAYLTTWRRFLAFAMEVNAGLVNHQLQ